VSVSTATRSYRTHQLWMMALAVACDGASVATGALVAFVALPVLRTFGQVRFRWWAR
jgi:hypothetical protein